MAPPPPSSPARSDSTLILSTETCNDVDEPKKISESNGSSFEAEGEKRIAGDEGMDEKCVVESGKEREYLWVEWEENDPENPRHWPNSKKWTMSVVGITFCALVSICVSGYAIAQTSIQRELGVNKTVSSLGITLFTVTFGAAPLLLAPLSELYGRSVIYQVSAFFYAIFFIPQAVATNIETILVFRLLSGVAGSTAVSLVGGTLTDLWSNEDRADPMSLFSFAAFAATGLGPVMFSYVEENRGFRLVTWIIFAMSAAFFVVIYFTISETRASVLLSRRAAALRKSTGDERYRSREDVAQGPFWEMMKTNLSRPLRMLFTEPILASFALYITFIWGVLYICLEGIPLVFVGVYQFTIGQAGLVFSTQIVGSVFGLFVDRGCQVLYYRHFDTYGPEARLYTAMAGGFLTPFGCWIYAWTSQSQIHWIFPCIGMGFLYSGLLLIYLSIFTYLADAYGLYASSALSAQSFLRNVVGACFPLFTPAMYDTLGVQGTGSLMSAMATVFAITPFLLFKYGATLRMRSPFAKELAAAEEERSNDS